MLDAFVIMQIGNKQLDKIWAEVYFPAIEACGLKPKRVDKHNEGRLLQSEIAEFVKRSAIIIADLTNERPNCYLEVGYAMGVDKFKNLILCAREDHHHESESYKKGGSKIHFDLSGYGFKWWNEKKLDVFKKELISTIKHRLEIVKASNANGQGNKPFLESSATKLILEEEREKAMSAAAGEHTGAWMEIYSSLDTFSASFNHKTLLEAARKSQIRTFGWPIGVVMESSNNSKPKPRADGLVAVVSFPNSVLSEAHFDYWTLKKNGDFYLSKTIFDDHKEKRTIFFDTRTIRITEAFLYLCNLYENLGIPNTEKVGINITHGGLLRCNLSAANPGRSGLMSKHICEEDVVGSTIEDKLSNIRNNLAEIVYQFISELLIQFDLFEPPKAEVIKLVDSYAIGKVV